MIDPDTEAADVLHALKQCQTMASDLSDLVGEMAACMADGQVFDEEGVAKVRVVLLAWHSANGIISDLVRNCEYE